MNSIVDKAKAYALGIHAGQFRRDGVTPYYTHVEAVANKLRAWGCSEEVQAVGACHDVKEDGAATDGDLQLLGFDREMIEAVNLLTKQPGQNYEAYIKAIKAHPMAKTVKMADIVHNLSDAPSKKNNAPSMSGR